MRNCAPRTYETAAELEQRLQEREQIIADLEGPEKQAALIELSKLRNYAQAKRWLEQGRSPRS